MDRQIDEKTGTKEDKTEKGRFKCRKVFRYVTQNSHHPDLKPKLASN
jgi:hypothetical protein